MVAEEKRKLSDPDLGHHLDDLINTAILDRKYTVIVDSDAPDEDTRIVPVTARDGKTAMVVMRQYQPSGYPRPRVVGGPGKPAPYAVTVLASESAASNYASGRWKVPNRPLADKLAHVRPVKETPAPLPPAPAPKPAPKTEAPVVPIASARRQSIPVLPPDLPLLPGPARGGTVVERIEYVKEILRARPNIRYGGADGLQTLIKAKFGTGMSQQVVQQVRDSIIGELSATPAASPTPLLTVGKPTPPNSSAAAKLATQLAEALAHEARAKLNLAEAQVMATEATEQVERIMKELSDLRK